VLDFGLVSLKPSIASANPTLTAKGHLIGTPAYMPPEMAIGSSPVDARSDLYALGCVAYYLLTSEDPFSGGSVVEVVLGHVTQAPRPPSQVAAQPIPEELDEIVLACLAKLPAERPQSADELLARLERCPVASPWTQERARRWWEEHTLVTGSPPVAT
jgi:serine/threonine-protein kinase